MLFRQVYSAFQATLGVFSHITSVLIATAPGWGPIVLAIIILRLLTKRRFRQRWAKPILIGGKLTLIGYGFACLLLWVYQPRLLYNPTQVFQYTPDDHKLPYEELWLPVAGTSQQLHGWWIPAQERLGTLIYFHGAGLNISYNVGQARTFRKLGFDVLLVEYRGYGLSEGAFPKEQTFYQDADTALHYLTHQQQIPLSEIIAYGHSLGGAIAIDLATKHPDLAGIIIHNSFTSMLDMVKRTYYARWFPVQWILNQHFDSMAKVKSLHMPALFIHATGDPLIPAHMGKALYTAAPERKTFILVDSNVHHNADKVYKTEEHLAQVRQFAIAALASAKHQGSYSSLPNLGP